VARFQTLLLDLDDTLYPASSGVWEAIGERINRFMIEVAGIDPDQAGGLRQFYFEHYGTSLNGLRMHHDIDPLHYLSYVHEVPLEEFLSPDPDLRRMLQDLAAPPMIFTNADSVHALRVLSILGVAELVGGIIDIVALEWINKPRPEAYRRAMALSLQDDPGACLVVDDQVRNLAPAAALGMGTVLVGPAQGANGIDHTIARAADLLQAVPDLARAPHSSTDAKT
jgi:putative hydrolase of the HAD superfamily